MDVAIGHTVVLELPLGNAGELDIEGWVQLDAPDGFDVFPEYIYATSGNTDGVVVSFTPVELGAQSGALVITSNDPARPELEIPIAGTGVLHTQPEGDTESHRIQTCGCAAPMAPVAPSILALLGAFALVRRRRSEA